MVLKLSLYPLPFISLPNAFSSSLGSRMWDKPWLVSATLFMLELQLSQKIHCNCFVGGTGHLRRRNLVRQYRRWNQLTCDVVKNEFMLLKLQIMLPAGHSAQGQKELRNGNNGCSSQPVGRKMLSHKFYFIVLFSSSYLLPFGFHGCSASAINNRVSRKFDVLSFYWSSRGPKTYFLFIGAVGI